MIFFILSLTIAITTVTIVFASRYIPIYVMVPFLILCSYIVSNIVIDRFGYAIPREYIERGTKGMVLYATGDYVLYIKDGTSTPRLVKMGLKEGDAANKELQKDPNVQKSIQFGEENLAGRLGFDDQQEYKDKNKIKVGNISRYLTKEEIPQTKPVD